MLAPGGLRSLCRSLIGGGPSPPRKDARLPSLGFLQTFKSLGHRWGSHLEGKGNREEQGWVPGLRGSLGIWELEK